MNDLLSTEVRVFYEFSKLTLTNKDREFPEHNYFDIDGLLDWHQINILLELPENGLDLQTILKNFNECRNRSTGFYSLLRALVDLPPYTEDLVKKYSEWTHRTDEILLLLTCKTSAKLEIRLLEQILLFSSILEFSLGNIFLSVNVKYCYPPHLFKDLLKSDELTDIFPEAIPFLRYILGTPLSVNLRNIAWHGFLRELNEVYSKLILTVILSLGRDLSAHKNDLNLRARPFCVDSIEKFKIISENDPRLLEIDLSWIEFQEENEFIKQSYREYLKKEYGRCLLLLLPFLESTVREMFGKVNNFNTKARIDGYYFTLDMVLDQDIGVAHNTFRPNSKNKIKELLSDSTLCMFYDFFTSPKGPRIRDRSSHGELKLSHIDDTTARLLIGLYTRLVMEANEMEQNNFQYESYYHPISELNRKMLDFVKNVQKFQSINVPNGLEINWKDCPIKCFNLILKPSDFLRNSESNKLISCLALLIQIIDNATKAIQNFQNSIQTRFKDWEEKKLSQSRRRTFRQTIDACPVIVEGLQMCLYIATRLKFMDLTTIKDLKQVLKTVENMKKYLSMNDWKSALNGVELIKNIVKNKFS